MKRLILVLLCFALLVFGSIGFSKIIEVPDAIAWMPLPLVGGSPPAGGSCTAFNYEEGVDATGKVAILSSVAPGSLVVCMLQYQDSAGTPTLSNGINSPDGYGAVVGASDEYVRFAYYLSSTETGSVTYTWTEGSGGGHTTHCMELSSDGTVSIDDVDAGATGTSATATSASETSTETIVAAFGGGGWYNTFTYESATIDGQAVDEVLDEQDSGYGSLGVMTMKLLSNPGTYSSAIIANASDAFAADLISFKCE